MQRTVFILTFVLCLVFADQAQAQRCLPGMQGIQITSGMVDGFRSSENEDNTGFYLGLAMTAYAKNSNKWVYGAEYLKRNYPYKNGHIPVRQLTGEGGYYYNFLTDGSKILFFSLGFSALAGYETVNKSEKLLYDGSTLLNKDKFLFGGAITLEMEAYLSDRVVLLLTTRERVLWGTTTGHFHSQFGIGLKFIIN